MVNNIYIMSFVINHTEFEAQNRRPAVGIVIEGGLGKLGLEGVVAELTSNGGSPSGELATAVSITRDVPDGATLVVHPNSYRGPTESEPIAKAVASAIDTCGVLGITFEPPLSDQT